MGLPPCLLPATGLFWAGTPTKKPLAGPDAKAPVKNTGAGVGAGVLLCLTGGQTSKVAVSFSLVGKVAAANVVGNGVAQHLANARTGNGVDGGQNDALRGGGWAILPSCQRVLIPSFLVLVRGFIRQVLLRKRIWPRRSSSPKCVSRPYSSMGLRLPAA